MLPGNARAYPPPHVMTQVASKTEGQVAGHILSTYWKDVRNPVSWANDITAAVPEGMEVGTCLGLSPPSVWGM